MRRARVFQIGKVRWSVLIGAIAIVCSACFAPASTYTTDVVRTAPYVDSEAPDFSLSALDGRQVSLSDWRGQVVLLNFWATWCVPCRAEMPEIQAAYQAYRAQDFVVLSINEREDEDAVAQFAEAFHLTFPVLLDRDGSTARRYGVRGLPTSFLINHEGVIRAVRVGEMNRTYIESQLTVLGVLAVSELAPPMPATPPPDSETQQLNLDDMFPPGKGRDLVLQNCTTCHQVTFTAFQRRTRVAWMAGTRGSKISHSNCFPRLSAAEVDTMYEYLAANFNTDVPLPKVPPEVWKAPCLT